jgi:hypothetical protein
MAFLRLEVFEYREINFHHLNYYLSLSVEFHKNWCINNGDIRPKTLKWDTCMYLSYLRTNFCEIWKMYRCPRVEKKLHNVFVIKIINFFFFFR